MTLLIYYIHRLTATKVDSTYLGVYGCGRARTHDHRVGSHAAPYPITPHR